MSTLRISRSKLNTKHLKKILWWSLFLVFWCRLQISDVLFCVVVFFFFNLECLYGLLLSVSECWSIFNALKLQYYFQIGSNPLILQKGLDTQCWHKLPKFTKTPERYTEMNLRFPEASRQVSQLICSLLVRNTKSELEKQVKSHGKSTTINHSILQNSNFSHTC